MNEGQLFSCPICGVPAHKGGDMENVIVDCPKCGDYEVDMKIGLIGRNENNAQVRISGWIREQNEAGIIPKIVPDIQRRIGQMSIPNINERSARLLRTFAAKFGDMDSWYQPIDVANDFEIMATSYSTDWSQTMELIKVLIFEGKILNRNTLIQLNVPGLLAVEAMKRRQNNSARGFVAMDFAPQMNEAWTNGFDAGIRAAGFAPIRIDAKDFVGGITDEIMSEIRQARFVIADYTGAKAGVYFEAGFALGLGVTVIPTCRADEIGKLHFDIRHLNTLVWNDPADLAERLAKRIRAVLGPGPN